MQKNRKDTFTRVFQKIIWERGEESADCILQPRDLSKRPARVAPIPTGLNSAASFETSLPMYVHAVSRGLVRNVLNANGESTCIAARVTLEEFALSTCVTWPDRR